VADATDYIQKIANDYVSLDRQNASGDALPIRSLSAIATRHNAQDQLLSRLHFIDSATLTDPTAIESLHALRSCRSELWDINHTTRWRADIPLPRRWSFAGFTILIRYFAQR